MSRNLDSDETPQAFKDSGVDWLGSIPRHWDVAPLRARFRVELGKMLDSNRIDSSRLSPYLRNIDVQWDKINVKSLPEMTFEDRELARYSLADGDLLVCEGGEVGRAAIWSAPISPCFYQKVLHRLRAIDGNTLPRFMYYLLVMSAGIGVFRANGNPNTIDHLTAEAFRSYRFPWPPIEEQVRIASFLDEKTARIDGLIEKKRALLERLAEKRQALITRAVTKGLNPDAPLKPSGIDWLGGIPAHWELKRFRFAARLVSGSTPTTTVSEYWDGDIPWISPKDVKADELFSSVDHVTEYAISDYGLKLHEENNAVIVIRGMILARKVPVAIARGRYTINQDMKVIRSKGEVTPEFFQMYLSSIESFLFTLVAEAGHGTKALRTDVLSDVPVLLPPIEEQRSLTTTLTRNRKDTDAAMERIRDPIESLKEYRSALITAAVTGQIAELR